VKRAWTEGPWLSSVDQFGGTEIVDSSGSQIASGRPTMYADAAPNAALIALAPEMAEAILAWDDNGQCAPPDSDALVDLAAKLRAIGGK
jgi:hypothetical protein